MCILNKIWLFDLYLETANLLPNLKFSVFFWKHCIIETQVSLMLTNTVTKPNLL